MAAESTQVQPGSGAKIMVVDDEPHQLAIMEEAIKGLGHSVVTFSSPTKALYHVTREGVDVVVTDLSMPEMTGIQLLKQIQRFSPNTGVIVVTAHGSIETAVEAMKKGAQDYLQKPVEFGALEIALDRVLERRALVRQNLKLRTENDALKRDLGVRFHIVSSIGTSPAVKQLVKDCEIHLKKREPLMILGETGTCKRDIARMIHYNSPWNTGSVLTFNCREVPEELQEVQLFGEEGGVRDGIKIPGSGGLVEKAHLGTLIISNLMLLSRRCQARLMTVIGNKTTQRVGGHENHFSDVRVITVATPADVKVLEDNRWDLHRVLKDNVIKVPALRERMEDIPLLALGYAKQLGPQYEKTIEKVDKDLLNRFINYGFPGNYRELESIVEMAVIRATGDTLTMEDLTIPAKAAGK